MDSDDIIDKLAKDSGNQNTAGPIHNEVYGHKPETPENSTGVAGLDHLYRQESRENFLKKEPLGFLLRHRQNKYSPQPGNGDSKSIEN